MQIVSNPQALSVKNETKETESSTLYLKVARAIEAYSNAIITQRVVPRKAYSVGNQSSLFSRPSLETGQPPIEDKVSLNNPNALLL